MQNIVVSPSHLLDSFPGPQLDDSLRAELMRWETEGGRIEEGAPA